MRLKDALNLQKKVFRELEGYLVIPELIAPDDLLDPEQYEDWAVELWVPGQVNRILLESDPWENWPVPFTAFAIARLDLSREGPGTQKGKT